VSGIRSSIVISCVVIVLSVRLSAQDITVTKERDLSFGMTVAGTTQEFVVNLDDPGSAFFHVTGPRNANVYISFVLPAELQNNNGSGTIPLMFDETSAGWNRRQNQTPPPGNQFDPAVGSDARIHPGGGGQFGSLFVWLGGMISIDAQQPAGAYSETATIIIERTDL